MGSAMGTSSKEPLFDMAVMSVGHFEMLRNIGEGGFGTVRAIRKRHDPEKGVFFAMKELEKSRIVSFEGGVDEVVGEFHFLKDLHHPFLCNLHWAFQDRAKLYMVMDMAMGGDLRFQLHAQSKGVFDETCVKFFAFQIAAGIEHLHEHRIIHRDVKPENMLMSSNGYIKICDFGIAKKLDDEGFCVNSSGTLPYMAPEILKVGHRHGTGADWFSLGVSLHELLTRKRPYADDEMRRSPKRSSRTGVHETLGPEATQKILRNFIARGRAGEGHTDECKDFVALLIVPEYKNRLGYQESFKKGEDYLGGAAVLKHPFLCACDARGELMRMTKEAPYLPRVDGKHANCSTNKAYIDEAFGFDTKKTPTLTKEQNDLFDGFSFSKDDELKKSFVDYKRNAKDADIKAATQIYESINSKKKRLADEAAEKKISEQAAGQAADELSPEKS